MPRSRWFLPAVAASLAIAVGACGDDDGGSSGGDLSAADDTVTVLGQDIEFDQVTYEVGGPEVGIVLENVGRIRHTLVIEDERGFRLDTNPGDTDGGTVRLDPGEYTIYCDVAGHQAAGMESTLVVD